MARKNFKVKKPKPVVPESILQAIKDLQAAQAMVNARTSILHDIQASVVLSVLPDINPDDMVFGGHDCHESPTGYCVYDDAEDMNHDSCLFCNDPQERD
jgi:hypothetical protein